MEGRDEQPGETAPRSSFVATVIAVLSAFIGIRKRKDYHRDAVQLKPLQVIVVGVMCAALLLLTVIMVVKLLIANM
ncbi:MAG TPA: DUF2970 domain-containing protein [Rhodocyclaceae bacterium]|nr:DUF2970 domain-containing protein [Rhodocyclaceae bacterium]